MLRCNQSGRFGHAARWAACFVATLLPCALQAHDPLDTTSRLTLTEDRIQLTVTMGLDGVREILTKAGFSPHERTETIASRGPKAIRELPVALASRLFKVRSDGQTLPARKVAGRSDGMEVEFYLDYPRPGGAVELEAVYFDDVPPMRPGWLVAVDEDGNQLLGVMLSSADRVARLVLPPSKEVDSSPASAPDVISGVSFSEKQMASRPVENPAVAQKSRSLARWFGFGGVAIGCVWLVLRTRRKIKNANEY